MSTAAVMNDGKVVSADQEAIICLLHDGVATNNITGKRYIDHWREAGFECETPIKNSGTGAATMRIEAARRIFPRCWSDGKRTEAGRDALGYYHEPRDENRNVGWVQSMTGRVTQQMRSATLRLPMTSHPRGRATRVGMMSCRAAVIGRRDMSGGLRSRRKVVGAFSLAPVVALSN
jgi:hypothetical protein